jgi:hypothetical protein
MWILILLAPLLMVISGGATALNEIFDKQNDKGKKAHMDRQATFIANANKRTAEKKNPTMSEPPTPTP